MATFNNVGELIKALSEYPEDKGVYSNQICENMKGEILLVHKPTVEELEHIRRREREREEEAERGRDMRIFSSRW